MAMLVSGRVVAHVFLVLCGNFSIDSSVRPAWRKGKQTLLAEHRLFFSRRGDVDGKWERVANWHGLCSPTRHQTIINNLDYSKLNVNEISWLQFIMNNYYTTRFSISNCWIFLPFENPVRSPNPSTNGANRINVPTNGYHPPDLPNQWSWGWRASGGDESWVKGWKSSWAMEKTLVV